MFAKANLVRNMYAACFCESVLSLLLFFMGIGMVQSTHYRLALGSRFTSVAGGFIFVGISYAAMAVFAYCGGKHHNKFILLLHLGGLAAFMAFQSLIAYSGLQTSVPDYPYDVQDKCLTNSYVRNATNAQACAAYFQSEMYNDLRAAWRSYYSDNLVDPTVAMNIQDLQDTHICCGFGPPNHCVNDTAPLTSSESTPRQVCAAIDPDKYPTTRLCYAGGACDFDQPIGSCGVNGAGLYSKGCASALHRYHAATLQTICIVVLAMLILPALGSCTTLCLCFKRKDEDVMPAHLRISVRPATMTKVYCRADVEKAERDW
ncbi:hypothetical protein SDRG_06296 [Saprolegnia diclina VS20]|uniref:Tetraspanin n=1 Tax=Saprolegnia diclina (strain VS20) TaxID=1156394 RepID=T0RUP1_SAPDV|nr:hypothetical protein SDRG_06296 [Saprolegnia diclina VS20]EQC36183.1 hypothetical protein SDRG_06296 [Saprolegnia diclina VS20]|eukprot:XP_008610289.1 hypothetical protein SDRG_06296 [Saprolegnia diclina VS20]